MSFAKPVIHILCDSLTSHGIYSGSFLALLQYMSVPSDQRFVSFLNLRFV